MSDINTEHGDFEKNGGFFELPKGILRVSGPESVDFLHRITTQNIQKLTPGNGLPTALLQGNGMIISYFNLYHAGNFFLIVSDKGLHPVTAGQLEKLHFAEDLTIADVSSDFAVLSVQGPRAAKTVKEIFGRVPEVDHEILGREDGFIAAESDFAATAGRGFHLFLKPSRVTDIKNKLTAAGLPLLSGRFWDAKRIESGHFTFGVDANEKNLILELALADHVSRDKGCYPGQEVVERVFTYGNVAKKLVGIEWSSATGSTEKAKLLCDGKDAGQITSVHLIPWSGKKFGFAVVRKPFYEKGTQLTVGDGGETVRVVPLPSSFDIVRELRQDKSTSI